jgi:hypothetical protein
MPYQVNGQSVAKNSLTLEQDAGAEAGGAVSAAAWAMPAIALMSTTARTDFFTVIPFIGLRRLNANSLFSIDYNGIRTLQQSARRLAYIRSRSR